MSRVRERLREISARFGRGDRSRAAAESHEPGVSGPGSDPGTRSEPTPAPSERPEPVVPTLGDLSETRRERIGRRLGRLVPARRRSGSAEDFERDLDRQTQQAAGGSGAARAVRELRSRAAAVPGIVGGWMRERWHSVPLMMRRRLGALLILVAALALVWGVLIPAAPCAFPGGDRCPPDDDAIALVPADAELYAHLSLEPDSEQAESARLLAERLPTLIADLEAQLPRSLRRDLVLDGGLPAWAAGEVAIAALGDASSLSLIESDDPDGAIEFVEQRAVGALSERELGGIEIRTDTEGTAAALVGGFLAIGSESGVERAIGLAAGEGDSLEDADVALRDELPDARLADLWAGPEVIGRLGNDGGVGPFDTFINAAASEGLLVSLGVDEEGVELSVISDLDLERLEDSPGVLRTLPRFEPELPGSLDSEALVYLGVGNPSRSASELLNQASDAAPQVFGGIQRFGRRLQRQSGVDLLGAVLPLLDGEAALTVEPAASEEDGADENPGGAGFEVAGTPFVGLSATGVDREEASEELAQLQGPLAEALASRSLTPTFESREVAGVETQVLRVSPVVELSYALFDDRLVAGTSPAAVERARDDGSRLDDTDLYERSTEGLPDSGSLFLYLDFRDLLTLGEAVGLAVDPAYALRAPDLRAIDAVGLAVDAGEERLATELRVAIGEREDPELEPDAAIESAP